MEIRRDRKRRTLEILQTAYTEKILEDFGMSNCNPVSTPVECVLERITDGSARPDKYYMQIVGSLSYLAQHTRPDCLFAVQNLSRHLQATGATHMAAAKRLLRYLKGTVDLGIKFSATDDPPELLGYSDADYASDKGTRRSVTGTLFFLCGGPVSWESRLQPSVALSTCEAELMAACAATQEAVHLRQLLKDLTFVQSDPTRLKVDNQGTIALAENGMMNKRSKHIDVRFHFIQERIASEEIKLEYVPSKEQLADLLTKPKNKIATEYLRGLIMGS
jgi:hypothetical protein